MKVDADKKFLKDFRQIQDNRIREKIEHVITQIRELDSILDIPNIEKLAGHEGYYRIKFDYNYRIGLFYSDDWVVLLRVGGREGFYKSFPSYG
jgi:Txe/YoeB family toxin of Txe-Axe toxin-antitoxin module